jgi:hypothetical protein
MTTGSGCRNTGRELHVTGLSAEERHRELVRARCALSIARAQYSRALRLARTSDASERATHLAEANRLSRLIAARAAEAAALQAPDRASVTRPERDCDPADPARPTRGLRAA